MKFTAVSILTILKLSSGFTVTPKGVRSVTTRVNAEGGKINQLVDLTNPKVVTNDSLNPGDKKVYCRCWKSAKFPLCDATHATHNKVCVNMT